VSTQSKRTRKKKSESTGREEDETSEPREGGGDKKRTLTPKSISSQKLNTRKGKRICSKVYAGLCSTTLDVICEVSFRLKPEFDFLRRTKNKIKSKKK